MTTAMQAEQTKRQYPFSCFLVLWRVNVRRQGTLSIQTLFIIAAIWKNVSDKDAEYSLNDGSWKYMTMKWTKFHTIWLANSLSTVSRGICMVVCY